MELVRARIRDFQSIEDAELSFGKFTVLTGPSSSGKSASFRAIKALFRNTFVPSHVRMGCTKAVVEAEFSDGTVVRAERGKSISSYHLNDKSFTKTGRTIPDEVLAAIKFPLIEGVDGTFSFQFDRPFLLSESGSSAASVVGSLTNVSALHAGVREANRRRGLASSTHRVRKEDEAKARERLPAFKALEGRKEALDAATHIFAQAKAAKASAGRLRALVSTVEASQARIDSVKVPEFVDVSGRVAEAQKIVDSISSIKAVVSRAESHLTKVEEYGRVAVLARNRCEELQEQYDKTLADAGVCPTCGKETH